MNSATARPDGVEGQFEIDNFRFESGETLEHLRIGFVRFGRLNASADNLLLVLPGTSNTRTSSIEHIGPGRAYDTERYCVVCTDAIGGGTSSSAADGLGWGFPRYTVRDLVHAQVQLARQGLGLGDTPIAVLAGASMGAFQTLEWIVHYPQTVRNAILLVPAWRAGMLFRLAAERMFDFVDGARCAPPERTQQALHAALRGAGRHYFAWTVTDPYLSQSEPDKLRQEVEVSGDRFAAWDPASIVRRYEASSTHDLAKPFAGDLQEALRRVTARTLVVACAQDRLLGVEGAKEIARGIAQADYREVDSTLGHSTWRPHPGAPHTQTVTRYVRDFLGIA